MIVAEKKPFDEILDMTASCKKVLVLGCGSCVTVCLTGGERQAEMLASQLTLAGRKKNPALTVDFNCITRQCDREFTDNLEFDLTEYDAVVSIACGVGVGLMSELFPNVRIVPGLNTTFYGASKTDGVWEEYCHGCGDCALGWTGGICPIARCSKGLINGACGGTNNEKCEVSDKMDCGWYLIYKRLKEFGQLDELRKIRAPRNWSKDRSGGVRRLNSEEMAKIGEE